jgi:DNA-binding MarR family transcriptional regulator
MVAAPPELSASALPLSGLLTQASTLARAQVMERLGQEPWAQGGNLRPACIGAMHCIAAFGPLSQRQISEVLGLDPSDIVTVIDILEAHGLMERRRDPADRRRYSLLLTEKGREGQKALVRIADEAVETILAPLDAVEREAFRDMLSRIVTHHRQL